MAQARTLFDKIWDQHVVRSVGEGVDLLHVDRHLLHDLSGARALSEVREKGHQVHSPQLALSTPDHTLSTAAGRDENSTENSRRLAALLRGESASHGIAHFPTGHARQGIVHVIGPELGFTLPGSLLVCGDSHTSTHGALGALAFGIGSSEVTHVLATQCVRQRRPRRMRITVGGALGAGVTAKDLILHIIGQLGVDAGTGYAVEYAGPTIGGLSVEERMTVCNLSIEFGARMGLVAPDQTTFDYLAGRPFAPQGADWDAAVAAWSDLVSDADAVFDHEEHIDAGDVAPQITWGTSPEHTVAVTEAIPTPGDLADPIKQSLAEAALDYQGLTAGAPIAGTPVDWVFIGSCTNGRLSDLQSAAAIARGRRVAAGVTARIVPGSMAVKAAAEAEGLDRVFTEAGFEWREPGCAQCVSTNGEFVPEGARCVSTSNRNFVGRQGPGARTHLASPAMAAAAAIAGQITDSRSL